MADTTDIEAIFYALLVEFSGLPDNVFPGRVPVAYDWNAVGNLGNSKNEIAITYSKESDPEFWNVPVSNAVFTVNVFGPNYKKIKAMRRKLKRGLFKLKRPPIVFISLPIDGDMHDPDLDKPYVTLSFKVKYRTEEN